MDVVKKSRRICQDPLSFAPRRCRITKLAVDRSHNEVSKWALLQMGPAYLEQRFLIDILDIRAKPKITSAAGLCFTSGTTSQPKGVLYSHRSNFLHTLMVLQEDLHGLSARDTVLPIVPMFHANAWGLAFSAPAVGAKLVMPGENLGPAVLGETIEIEDAPKIWSSQGVSG